MKTYTEIYACRILHNPDVRGYVQLEVLLWWSRSERYLRLQVSNQEKVGAKQENYSFDTLQVIVEEKGCEGRECGRRWVAGERRTPGKLANPRERLRSFITSTTLNRQNCRASGGRRARPRRNEESGGGEVKSAGRIVEPGKREGSAKKVVARTPLREIERG